MDYSFITTPEGNIQTSQGGKIISTGTAESAATNYGYKAPATPPPIQQTTTSMRTTASQNSEKLDTKLTNLGTTTETKKANLAGNPVDPNAKPDSSAGAGVTMNEATARQLFGNDFTGLKSNPDGTYTADSVALGRLQGTTKSGTTGEEDTINTQLSSDISSAKTSAQTQVDSANTTLDTIAANGTIATNALIESIKTTFQARIDLMNQSNDKLLKGKTQEGIRSGRSRYVSDVQDGILSDEEQAGIARIGDLNGQMLTLIAQAETARTNQDLDIFNKRMDSINTIDDNLQNEVQNLQKNASDQLKAIQDKIKAQNDQDKQNQQMQLDKSERVAPALSESMAGYTDPKDQATFIEEYSKQSGIPVEILLGDISAYNDKSAKAKLDVENIKNEIANRNATTKTTQERLKLDQQKQDFNPSDKDRSTVGKYLSTKGTPQDVEKAKTDPDFFYYVLKKAEDAAL